MPVFVYYTTTEPAYTWYHPKRECYLVGRLRETSLNKFEITVPAKPIGWHDNASRCAACGEYVNWPTEPHDD